MKKNYLTLIMFLFFSSFHFSQTNSLETSSEVTELNQFHKVIYKVWHNAWPKKDITLLQSLLPDIEEGSEKLTNAKLPGILRDKKEKWNLGIAELNNCVSNYKNASINKDSVQLLNSAERLHSQFESLVRIIKPVTKEMDQFHQELYLLYHYYMPAENYDKIVSSSKELENKIDSLKNSKLPERLQNKNDVFEKEVTSLEIAVQNLRKVSADNKNFSAIKEAVNIVHNNYQTLEKIFE